jgi:hypothetical protein
MSTPTHLSLASCLLGAALLTATAHPAAAQATAPKVTSPPPYIVEWVYRAKWGYKEEYLELFKKYQVPVLDRLKQLGYVVDYAIYTPALHTSEDNRWDYRVVITYKDQASSTHEAEVSKQIFPDQAKLKREEQRRWELTVVHWDLPIRIVDPHGTD